MPVVEAVEASRPWWSADGGDVTVHVGDCLDVLSRLPDHSADALITDPPYGLSGEPDPGEVLTHWLNGDDYLHRGGGFMGVSWDSFVPGPSVWKEALRVCRPGAPGVVFASVRTVDLMMAALRIAGWEVLGTSHWTFGSGFPKSVDVARQMDRVGGQSSADQAAALKAARQAAGLSREQVADRIGCTASSVRDWEDGRARAAGLPVEWVVPSSEYRSKLADLLGYSLDRREVLHSASTDRRGDGTVLGLGHSGAVYGDLATGLAQTWSGWGTSLKPAHEPLVVVRAPGDGDVRLPSPLYFQPKAGSDDRIRVFRPGCGCEGDPHAVGGDPDAVAATSPRACAACGAAWGEYQHVTVKPVRLCEQLCEDLLPSPGMVALDPFAGTGTTGAAALAVQRSAVLIERDPVHAAMIRARVSGPVQVSLFGDWS